MGYVYIYGPTADDFSTTGLCGALTPTSCEHEEIANGMSTVTLVHPFDPWGKWRAIKRGCILSCDVRVRTTPEIENGQVVTNVEIWTVKATATVAQRVVYSEAKGGRKLRSGKPLKAGVEVTVVKKGESRYKIKYGGVNGWISQEGIEFTLTPPPLSDDTDSIEAVAPPWEVRPQLFRVYDVEVDTDGGRVTAQANHISYDLAFDLTHYQNKEPLSAQTALDGIMDGCRFNDELEAFTDSADVRTSIDCNDINPVEALLEPESGFAARWGLELIRDNFGLYFLRRAGRDRGTRIWHGKNLLGVNFQTSDEGVVTAILPRGVKKDGAMLYLTDDPASADNYVFSAHMDEYPVRRTYTLDCEDCTVNGKAITKELARTRMREQAQRMFDEDHADMPSVNLTVDFIDLGDTMEYAQYKGLEPLYLHDDVGVIDPVHDIEVMAKVSRILWDCLLERMIEVELGNVRVGDQKIYSWQVQGIPGYKIDPGTLPPSALEDGSLPLEKLDPDLQEALNQAWADIEQAQGMIDTANAWLDTLDAQLETVTVAVGDNAGAISALQIAAEGIRAAVRDAEGNIAALEITANEIATALTDAEGNISTLQQTSSTMSSTITNMSGEISSIRQTATSLSSIISTLDGQVASLVTQTAEGVAVKLRNASIDSNFELCVTGTPSFESWGTPTDARGIQFWYNGAYYGGLFFDKSTTADSSYWNVGIKTPKPQVHSAHGWYSIWCCDVAHGGAAPMSFVLTDAYAVGKRVRASEAITVDSDRRLKSDIASIEHGEDLFDALKPVQYHMRGSSCRSFGFIAQDVRDAMRELGLPETVLLSEPSDPETGYYALNYQEIIALCVNKIQHQETRIDDLEKRLERLEGAK